MNTRPTYTSLEPREMAPFTPNLRRVAQEVANGRRRWGYWDGPKPDILPAHFDAADHVDPTAVAAITRAFTLAKTSHDDWRSYKREGRFDFRQAARASRGNTDVFKRRAGQSTTRIRCTVLIDASGSMRFTDTGRIPNVKEPGKNIKVTAAMAAAVFGVTIAKALGKVPTVDLDVWQHTALKGRMFLKYRWTKGTPVAVFNESVDAPARGYGENADGHALFALTEKMLRDLKRGERGLIMVVSDGLPSSYSTDGTSQAGQALIDAVAHARKRGIEVIAVAINGSDQTVYYGDGMIPFTNDWTALGSALAKRIGAALARR
jgi:hypothetical protein